MTTGLRLKYVARVDAGQSPPSSDVTPFEGEGLPFLQGNAEFGAEYPIAVHRCDSAPRNADEGALLVSVRAPVGAVNTADQRYGIGRGLAAVSPRSIHPRYAYWLLLSSSEWLNSIATGSTFAAISGGDLGDVTVPTPDERQQRAIADYLDRETAQIDAFIAKNEELITLLTERLAAIRAGLATGAEMDGQSMATGLFWAPRVPATWEVVPLSSVARLESGHTPSKTMPEFWREDECVIPWISLNDVSELTINEYIQVTTNRISPAGLAGSSARVLPEGTVVLSRDATIGRSSIMAQPMATSQHFADWVCGDRLLPRYLWLLFTSCMQGLFNSLTNGSTIRTIGIPDLKSFRIPLPSVAEQTQIVDAAAVKSEQIREAIDTATQARNLARERRAALISAAVTGKIDVGVAA